MTPYISFFETFIAPDTEAARHARIRIIKVITANKIICTGPDKINGMFNFCEIKRLNGRRISALKNIPITAPILPSSPASVNTIARSFGKSAPSTRKIENSRSLSLIESVNTIESVSKLIALNYLNTADRTFDSCGSTVWLCTFCKLYKNHTGF